MVSRLSRDDAVPPENQLYEAMRHQLSRQDFETWFKDTPCKFYPPNRLVLVAPNRFRKAWMEKNFSGLLNRCARSLLNGEVKVEFEVLDSPPAQAGPAAERSPVGLPAGEARIGSDNLQGPHASSTSTPPAGAEPSLPCPAPACSLNPEFTFESFIPSQANQLSHAAALAVCNHTGESYNPLLIHGPCGVGKTHLLQAIGHRLNAAGRLRVAYWTSESFLNQYVAAVLDSNLEAFRRSCRDADVVIIDDIHFLAGKEKTQEELFHIFNDLLDAGKQVILGSRLPPREIVGLEPRLASRFRSGLLRELVPPDLETRLAIVIRKAKLREWELLPEVARLIASQSSGDIRELEGALLHLVNLASFERAPLTLSMAERALAPLAFRHDPQGTTTLARIFRALEEYYHLKPKELLSRSKVRSIVRPRQIGMFLARQLTPLSLEEVGVHFGGRDHTTVLYAQRRIQKLLVSSPQLRADLHILKGRITSERPT